MRTGAVSVWFACSWDPFPHSVLPYTSLIGGYVPSIIVTCCAVFNWYLWEAGSWLKENGGEMDVAKREISWDGLGRVEERETSVGMQYQKETFFF